MRNPKTPPRQADCLSKQPPTTPLRNARRVRHARPVGFPHDEKMAASRYSRASRIRPPYPDGLNSALGRAHPGEFKSRFEQMGTVCTSVRYSEKGVGGRGVGPFRVISSSRSERRACLFAQATGMLVSSSPQNSRTPGMISKGSVGGSVLQGSARWSRYHRSSTGTITLVRLPSRCRQCPSMSIRSP